MVANVYLEGTYSEVYPAHRPRRGGPAAACSASSPSRGASPATWPRRRPARSTRAASWATRSSHAYGAAFDNPDLLVCAVVGDGEAETGPLAASWHSNKFLNPARDGAVLPILHLNGYKIANPTDPRPHPRAASCARCSRATATSRCFVAAPSRTRCTSRWPRALDEATAKIAEIQRAARAGGASGQAPLADDRAAHAQGLDRARRWSTGCRPRARSAPTRSRWPSCAAKPEHLAAARALDALLPARGAVRRARRACARSWPRSRPAASGAWAPTRTPTAACCCSELEMPDFRDYAVRGRAARHASTSEATRVLGGFLRDVITRNPRTFRLMGPDETASEPAGRRVRGHRPRVGGRDCWPTDEHLAPEGRVMEVLSEHLCQGWLEGYLLTGRHGLFNCYEAFIHIVDSMFNQHAKWLKVTRGIPWRGADRLAELPALLARLAPGPQRLLPPGPRLHRPRRQQEGRGRAGLPAARHQLPAVGRRPLPAQPRLRERDRRRQAARARLPLDGGGDRPLHARDRHVGLGQQRRRAGARRGAGVRGRRAHARDAGRRRDPDARAARAEGARRERRRPDAPGARQRAPPRPLRPRVRRPLHHLPARDLRLPRLPPADPPAHLPAHQPRTTSTCAATRRRAPPRRRSTWSCSTTSTASTW